MTVHPVATAVITAITVGVHVVVPRATQAPTAAWPGSSSGSR